MIPNTYQEEGTDHIWRWIQYWKQERQEGRDVVTVTDHLGGVM